MDRLWAHLAAGRPRTFVMTMPIAAKYLSGVSTESVYSCTFPGSPVRINMPLDLISRLQTDLERNERLANSSCTEIGGVLLGRPKTQTTLDIDDYIWVSSDQPGSQYHLDASELERLSAFYTAISGPSPGTKCASEMKKSLSSENTSPMQRTSPS